MNATKLVKGKKVMSPKQAALADMDKPKAKGKVKPIAVKKVEKVEKPKTEKAKAPKEITRYARMKELLLRRELTDNQIYEQLDAEFGPGPKTVATNRAIFNNSGKYPVIPRLVKDENGDIVEAAPRQRNAKEKKELDA